MSVKVEKLRSNENYAKFNFDRIYCVNYRLQRDKMYFRARQNVWILKDDTHYYCINGANFKTPR